MKMKRIVPLIASMLLPLAIGMISAALSSGGMASYANMNKPPLSPPAWVFPAAWTILYLMMGLASYYVITSETAWNSKKMALILYAIQLGMNFFWSILFFNLNMYLAAFFWLLIMWSIVFVCIFRFFGINRLAGVLMVPYICWLTFAAYLNMGSFIIKNSAKP